MDCAISVFGGAGVVSFLLFLLFVAILVFLMALSKSVAEIKSELRELRRRLEGDSLGESR